MLEDLEFLPDGLDRTFIHFSSQLAEPFCWGYGMLRYRFVSPLDPNKFDNTTSKVKEIATRALIFGTAALTFVFAAHIVILSAVTLGAASQLFRALGFALQKENFTHIRGLAEEKELKSGEASVMTWKLCGEVGGLSYKQGGVINWRSRLDRILDKIQTEDPDIIVLQEINDTALAEAIMERLQNSYAHFFTHLGGASFKSANGCMVITKCAVHSFSHNKLEGKGNFELFELKANPQDPLPSIRFIATKLIGTSDTEKSRQVQVSHIVDAIAKQTLHLPTFFVGTNGHRDSPTEGPFLAKYLHHSYRGEKPTHTDQLALQWDSSLERRGKTFDFISLFRHTLPDGTTLPVIEKVKMVDCHLIEAFDQEYNTQTALSSDHGIITRIGGLKMAK